MDRPFSVRVRPAGAAVAIEIRGDLDMFTATRLDAALGTIAPDPAVLIDLSECDYVDSAGLHVLRTFARERGPDRVTLIVPPGSPLRRVLEITELDRFFPIVPERPQDRG
jgi:anti-anti-sigma factor